MFACLSILFLGLIGLAYYLRLKEMKEEQEERKKKLGL